MELILISLLFWSYINPNENLWVVIGVGLIIAISSATQDITIDALQSPQSKDDRGNKDTSQSDDDFVLSANQGHSKNDEIVKNGNRIRKITVTENSLI